VAGPISQFNCRRAEALNPGEPVVGGRSCSPQPGNETFRTITRSNASKSASTQSRRSKTQGPCQDESFAARGSWKSFLAGADPVSAKLEHPFSHRVGGYGNIDDGMPACFQWY